MPTSSDTALSTILNIINDNGPISQKDMFALSGYSRAMISITCEQLISASLVSIDNSKTTNRKKNVEYCINKDLGYIIGIAIGGTSCRIGLFDILCNKIALIKEPINLSRGPDALLADICKNIDSLLEEHNADSKILGIGMGIPTPVKYDEGYANYPAFMPGWHMYDLKGYFKEKYGCPSFIDNEVNIIALEEFQHRENKNTKVLLCIKVGTGIGAGLVISNKIYRGENGGGGNIGHIQIPNSTELCECGKVGCIEAIASAPAVLKKATKKAKSYPNSYLGQVLLNKGRITLSDIKIASENCDENAIEIIREAGESVGELIGMLTMFADPGSIILSGQMTQLGPIYLYHIRNTIRKKVSPWIGHNFSVELTKYPFDMAAYGAARLCKDELFSRGIILSNVKL